MTTCENAEPGNGRPVCIQTDRLDLLDAKTRVLGEDYAGVASELIAIRNVLGQAPDLSRGTTGSGMAMVLHNLANALLQQHGGGPPAPPRPALVTIDEDEVTQVKRSYLAELKALEEARGKTRIEVWKIVAGIVASLVALGTAYLAGSGGHLP